MRRRSVDGEAWITRTAPSGQGSDSHLHGRWSMWPGATMVRPGRRRPWQVVAVTADTLRLRDLAGDVVEVSRRSVRPDPLDVPAASGA